jgi:CheY-like chemotaxis protein
MLGLFGGQKNRLKPLVLVVDDDDDIRVILIDILVAMGLDALGASNGSEGLKLALNELPELVLLDIRMPMMDGFDVCRAIKTDAKGKAVTVVMVTSMEQNKDLEKALANGADGYVTKPLDHIKFRNKIAEILKLPPPQALEA